MTAQRRSRSRVLINTKADARALDAWMEAARAAAPPVAEVGRLFQGADVIEVSSEEAEEILAWAEKVPGWDAAPAESRPLLFETGTMDIIPADE